MSLVLPSAEHLASYVEALNRGWAPDNTRGAESTRDELEKIARDASGFLSGLVDRQGKGPAVTLPDGAKVPRLPGFHQWIWDGEFCGAISLRWQPGTTALPPHCLGHIGYSVVEWKRNRGHATAALASILPEARAEGLPFVEITCDPENFASQRVIERNGGVLVERFIKPAQFGHAPGLRYRIALD